MISPFFSVIIPLYNKERLITRTLEAVLAQTCQDFEVVVVDDGSTDNGAAVVEAIAVRDARIRLIRQKNGGESAARNRGISEALGNYAAFLDADDWWLPGHLAELKELAVRFPEAGILSTACARVYAKPPAIVAVLKELHGRQGLLADYFKTASEHQLVNSSSVAIPLSVLRQFIHPFPLNVAHGGDLFAWFRLAVRYPIAYSGVVTANYDCNVPGQVTRVNTQRNRATSRLTQLLGEELSKLPADAPMRESILHYVRSVLFLEALENERIGNRAVVDELYQSQAQQLSRSWKVALIKKIKIRAVWDLYTFVRRVRYSRHFIGLFSRHFTYIKLNRI